MKLKSIPAGSYGPAGHNLFMLSSVEFKLGSLEDLESIEEAGAMLFDYEIKKQRALEFLGDPRHHIMLAYLRGKIIGMASGVHYVHPDKEPQLFISEVSVLKEYQRRGIGRALIKNICEHGKTLNCTEAWLGVDTSNNAARKAYGAAGGKEEKEPFILVNFK